MCRLLIILNRRYIINNIIDEFISQSTKPKNTPGLNNIRDHDYHLDGYGFIFYDKKMEISIYKSSQQYHKDYITHSLNLVENMIKNSNLIIGHLRATKFHFKDDICFNNTHPFWNKKNFMVHNGCIYPFRKTSFLKYISKKYIDHVKGTTDSEILFYIYMTIKDQFKDDLITWKNFFLFLQKLYKIDNIIVSANIVISNDNFIMISRYINNDDIPPSLYLSDDNLVISSEPVTEIYKIVPKNTSIIYNINSKEINIENINKYSY